MTSSSAIQGGTETVSLRCSKRSKQPKASTSNTHEAKRVAHAKRKKNEGHSVPPLEPFGLGEETDLDWDVDPTPSKITHFDTDDEGDLRRQFATTKSGFNMTTWLTSLQR